MQDPSSEDSDSLLHRAQRFSEFGEYAAARDILKTAVQNELSFAEGWFALGLVYEQLDSFNEARECFLQAMKLRPDWIDPIARLGMLEFEQKRYKEAAFILKSYL
jgi:tetratricopeptide (TPR) repeat protein